MKIHPARAPTLAGLALIATASISLAGCGAVTPQGHSGSDPLPTTQAPTSAPVTAAPATAAPAHSPKPSRCNPALWRHVYHAYRLHVVSACKLVTGTVEEVRLEADGDIHILLRLDPRYASLINAGNTNDEHGDLVLEPVCVGSVTQADAQSACHGFVSRVASVSPGDRVRVAGSYVLDADHGWMEIHPVSRIRVIGHRVVSVPASAQPTTAPAAPAPVAPAGCHPMTSGGNCYEPGEFCSGAEHGETGVAGDGKTITCADVNGYWRWEG